MKKRIRYILALMSLCIAGILVLQAYWLFSSYKIYREEFERDINECLTSALQRKEISDIRNLMQQQDVMPDSSTATFQQRDPSNIIIRDTSIFLFSDSSQTRVPLAGNNSRIERMEIRMSSDNDSQQVYIDTLARKISGLLVLNRITKGIFSLPQFDSVFRETLRARKISTPYRLDTARLQERHNSSFVSHPGYPVVTTAMRANPFNPVMIRASFMQPYQYILGKMMWVLIVSLLLLALITASFIYMLRTILKQKRLSDIKNDFINNMTHELKTPIATVSAAVEAMQNFNALNDRERTASYLSISKNELQRLGDLVEKVLNIAIEEKEDIVLDKEKTDITALVESIIANHTIKAAKPIQLLFNNGMQGGSVVVDKMHFANALNNLVDNAIKYSGDEVQVIIITEKTISGWVLRVQDNGVGIPKIYQEAVFDKFFRVPSGDLHNVKGFGLGLSYVKKIIEKHGGSIALQSEPGKGSVFEIRMEHG